MASRDIEKLVPELRTKISLLLPSLSFPILIYCTGRSAEEQARLWRQSRKLSMILEKKRILEKFGHEELAKILIDVGPCHGPHVTHAGPGESWHQYWQAFDAVPLIGGKPAWDLRKSENLWRELGAKATDIGLNWGGNWKKPRDFPHFQIPTTSNPLKEGIQGCILRESDL